ncbi:MAG: hypothetical protein ACRERS_06845, partial [Methylococcales bacterium]
MPHRLSERGFLPSVLSSKKHHEMAIHRFVSYNAINHRSGLYGEIVSKPQSNPGQDEENRAYFFHRSEVLI